MSTAVRISFAFLSEILGHKFVAGEICNLSQTVTLRTAQDEHEDTAGVAPSDRRYVNDLVDAFVIQKNAGENTDRLIPIHKFDWNKEKLI